MLGRTSGAVLVGVEARIVEVEVDLGKGLPTISAVGLPDAAVREGIDRIRASLRHAGFKLPEKRVTINLAPAEVRKQGAGLDLPIAAALLLADGQVPPFDSGAALLVGELGLDGAVRSVRGVLSVALAARSAGYRRLVVPRANADEAASARFLREKVILGDESEAGRKRFDDWLLGLWREINFDFRGEALEIMGVRP